MDSVVPGAVLLDELFTALNIAHMRVSPFALREGVLQATITRPTYFQFCACQQLQCRPEWTRIGLLLSRTHTSLVCLSLCSSANAAGMYHAASYRRGEGIQL